MASRRMTGLGSNGLNNIRSSSINSTTSHLNYHNPFGVKNKFRKVNPMKGRSFGDLSSSSMVYNPKNRNRNRVGSQIFGNGRKQDFFDNKNGENRFQQFPNKKISKGSLRSSSLVGKKYLIFNVKL